MTSNKLIAKDLKVTCDYLDAKLALKELSDKDRQIYLERKKTLIKARIKALGMYLVEGSNG